MTSSCAALAGGLERHLVTETFDLVVRDKCEHGALTCDRVTVSGMNRKTHKVLKLRGKSLVRYCMYTNDVCGWEGWIFNSGGTTYVIYNDARLNISARERTLVEEQGEWKE